MEASPCPSNIHRCVEKARHRAVLEQLLTFDDLAAPWHCSRKAVKTNWTRYGLRPIRIARRVLIPISQVIAFEQRMIERGERA